MHNLSEIVKTWPIVSGWSVAPENTFFCKKGTRLIVQGDRANIGDRAKIGDRANIGDGANACLMLAVNVYQAACKSGDMFARDHDAGTILRAAVMISEWKEPI